MELRKRYLRDPEIFAKDINIHVARFRPYITSSKLITRNMKYEIR